MTVMMMLMVMMGERDILEFENVHFRSIRPV